MPARSMRSWRRPSGSLIEGRVPLDRRRARAGGAGKTTLLERAPRLPAAGPAHRRARRVRPRPSTGCRRPRELGWRPAPRRRAHRRGRPTMRSRRRPVRPDDTVLLIPELSDHLPSYTWGAEARIAIRAASIGYGLAATIHADYARGRLRRAPTTAGRGGRRRAVAARRRADPAARRRRTPPRRCRALLRPTARDEHGHVQRLGPAVLATWDPNVGSLRAFRLGRHARARAPRRAQGRRLRARSRSPPRLSRRSRRGRHRRYRRRARRHRRLPQTTAIASDSTPITN